MNFGSVRVGDHLRFRTNRELYELFNDMDVAKRHGECLMPCSAIIGGRNDRVRVGKTRLSARRENWTSKSCDHNRRLSHSALNSQTSSVIPNLVPMTLVDYGPIFPTTYVLQLKLC